MNNKTDVEDLQTIQAIDANLLAKACVGNYLVGSDCFNFYNVGGMLCVVYPAIDAFQCEQAGLEELSQTLQVGG